MKIIHDIFKKISTFSDFRVAAHFCFACTAVLLLTPFAVNNFIKGRMALGFFSLVIVTLLGLNSRSLLKFGETPLYISILLIPGTVLFLILSTYQQGLIGIFWCYPAIISFYFLVKEKQAWLANLIVLIVIIPFSLQILPGPIATRAIITLTAVSVFTAILIRTMLLQQDKLNEAKERAETANKAKSVFLANMSHELRTPLNVILGFTQLLTRDAGLSAEQVASLETIGRSGEHLQSLINDVLELSKIEVGRIDLTPETFDLQNALLGLEEMFRLRAGQKGLRLEVSLDERLPRQVRTDRNKLRQVLINLLGNAVKFTDQGSVSLRVECLGRDEPAGCSQIRFTVTDTGVGIATEEQSRIFAPFYQAEEGVRTQQGTGLGLAISHKFVALLGGELRVSSEAGQGASFSFDLPVEVISGAPAESPRRKERIVGLAAGEPEYRLLVAEDYPDSRNFLTTLLKSVGFAVREAANGREALDLWQQWHPQLIWMDIRMPEMDGLEAIRAIRQHPEGRETVIIGLTAFAFEEDKQLVLAAGGDDFVRKPCTEEEIFGRLEKHLGVRFQYAERGSSELATKGAMPPPDRREIATMLENLSAEMLTRLAEALRYSDVAAIGQSIEEIGEINPRLGSFLRRLADDFAYDKILRYLDEDIG